MINIRDIMDETKIKEEKIIIKEESGAKPNLDGKNPDGAEIMATSGKISQIVIGILILPLTIMLQFMLGIFLMIILGIVQKFTNPGYSDPVFGLPEYFFSIIPIIIIITIIINIGLAIYLFNRKRFVFIGIMIWLIPYIIFSILAFLASFPRL